VEIFGGENLLAHASVPAEDWKSLLGHEVVLASDSAEGVDCTTEGIGVFVMGVVASLMNAATDERTDGEAPAACSFLKVAVASLS